MSKKRDPLDQFLADAAARAEARTAASNEATALKYVLKRFGLAKEERVMRNEHAGSTGLPELTFAAFNSRHPSFPVLLGYNRIAGVKLHADKTAMIPALFKSFTETPFFKAYETFFEEHEGREDGNRTIGLVFPRRGIKFGLIIHNGASLDMTLFRGTILTYHGGSRKRPHPLYVMPLVSLIEGLHQKGHGWRPD